jgi:hypothetical protein
MRHMKKIINTRQYRIKKVSKHSLKVFASAGIWYLSTYVHDTPTMLIIAIVGVVIQTIAEEFIGE